VGTVRTSIARESEVQLPARDAGAQRVAEYAATARELEDVVRRFADIAHGAPPVPTPLPTELIEGSLTERFQFVVARQEQQAALLEKLNQEYNELRSVSYRSAPSGSLDSVQSYCETYERARAFAVAAKNFLAERAISVSIIEERQRGLLESVGCVDRSELRERLDDLDRTIVNRQKRFLGLGRFLHRDEIKELDEALQQARSVDHATKQNLVAEDFVINFHSVKLEDLPAISEYRFQRAVDDLVRAQRYAIPEAAHAVRTEPIPREILAALYREEIESLASSIALRSQIVFRGQERRPDEQAVAEIQSVLAEGLRPRIEQRLGAQHNEDTLAIDTVRERIQALPNDHRYAVERALREDIPFRERSWKATWRWIQEHPVVADIRSINETHHRIGTIIGELPGATVDERRDFARTLQIDLLFRRDSESSRGDFVSGHDPRLFEAFVGHPLVRGYLGDAFIQSTKAVMEGEILDRFKQSSTLAKEERIEIGYQMMYCPSIEAAPLVLLHAFREPGHSGECPFRGNNARETDISTYVSKLSAVERAEPRVQALPGFLAAVDLIEKYPATYSHHHITNEAGEWVDNPQYAELQGHLLELTEHLLRTGDPMTRRHAAWVLRGIDSPLTEQIRETVVHAIVNPDESGLDVACLDAVLERLRLQRDVGSAIAVLDSIAARPELRTAIAVEHGYHLLRAMTASELAPSDSESLGKIIERSGEEVARVHGFIRALRRNTPFDAHYETHSHDLEESFSSYSTAASTPGVHAALTALGAYGYVFRREHLGVLPALIQAHESIVHDMERIRRYNPVFNYEPVVFRDRTREVDRYSIDPYAGLLMRYGAESQIDVLQKAYAEISGVDPLLIRAAYGAWRSRDTEGTPIFGGVDDVPPFFSAALATVVREAGSVEEESITPHGALIAHPMGQRLLSRSPVWAETMLQLAGQLGGGTGRAPAVARDRLYLILDTLREIDTGADGPPPGFAAWCEFVASTTDGVADGQLYTPVGGENLNNGLVRKELVDVLSCHHRFLGDPEMFRRIEDVVGPNGKSFARIFPAVAEVRSLQFNEGSFLRFLETARDSAARLGGNSEEIFRGALPALRVNGWLSSVDDFVSFLPKLEGIAAQGLAGAETWRTLAALYNPREPNPLLSGRDCGAPTREIEIFTEYIKTHGNIPLPLLYGAFHRCIEEQPFTAREQSTYGLRNTGKSGLTELRERATQVRQRLLSSDGTIDTTSPLEVEMIAAQSRFHSSEWARSDQTLEGRIQSFNDAWNRGAIEPLSSSFATASGQTFRVKRIDDRALERFEYAEDALHKLEQLRRDVVKLHGRSLEAVFRTERDELLSAVNERIADLSRPLTDEEQRRDISGRRAAARLEESARWVGFGEHLSAVNNVVGLVKAIAAFERKDDPVTTPVLRRCLARLGMEQIGGADSLRIAAEAPTDRGTIAQFVEFYGGIIRSDVMRDLGLTDHQSKRAGSAVHVKALTAELQRIEGLATAGAEVIGLRPTRGILAELSGFVCDACWTKEDAIVSRYPNLTTVVFVKNPGSASERLCGATLVLKVRSEATESSPAEDIFVVRGFNPLQNTITQVKADQFFEGFIGWLEGVARAEGVSKIVIPGGIAGGSQTNRPTIHTYVSGQYGGAPVVPLSSDVRSTFNGYDISRSCHLVRSTPSTFRRESNDTDATTPLRE